MSRKSLLMQNSRASKRNYESEEGLPKILRKPKASLPKAEYEFLGRETFNAYLVRIYSLVHVWMFLSLSMFATFACVLLGMLNVRPTFEGIAFDQKLGGTFCIRGVVRSRQKHPLSIE